MSLHRKVATVFSASATASLVAGLAAFAPVIFGWFMLVTARRYGVPGWEAYRARRADLLDNRPEVPGL